MKQVVFITGTSSGIGYVTANYLVQKGFQVYGFSRSLPKQKALFETIQGDVTKEENIIQALDTVIKKENRLDVVINNAGMGIGGAAEYTTRKEIEAIFNSNNMGTFLVCKHAIPYLRNTKGRILNIGSVAAELNIPFQSFYSATKASVQAYSMALRSELKPFHIKVSVVLPGDTKTEFTKNRKNTAVEVDKIYGSRIASSIQKMEQDEQRGMPAICVSKVILKLITKKHPSAIKTVGVKYKLFVFLKRLLPTRFVTYLIYKLYG
jgi:short-subunit dehydrogenase